MELRYFFVSPTNVADHRRGGASICSLAYLQALSAHAPGRVTLVSPLGRDRMPELPDGVDQVIEITKRSALSKLWRLASGNAVDRLSPFVDRLLRTMDLRGAIFFMNSSRGGRFSSWLRARGVPSITLFHNVEANYYAASERALLRRALLVRAAGWNDRMAFRHSAASIFLSSADADVMRRRSAQEVPGAMIVERGFFAPTPHPGDLGGLPPSPMPEILVNCSLGLPQNIPGLIAFLQHWRDAATLPGMFDARLVLAGADPAPEVVALARELPRVRIVANPSEVEMETLFAACRVCVSTISAGSGIKVRVSEALRRGRPVVATPHSCLGYEDIDPRVLLSCEVPSMMAVLREILTSAAPGGLELLARAEFDRCLSYASGSAALSGLLRRLEQRRS